MNIYLYVSLLVHGFVVFVEGVLNVAISWLMYSVDCIYLRTSLDTSRWSLCPPASLLCALKKGHLQGLLFVSLHYVLC